MSRAWSPEPSRHSRHVCPELAHARGTTVYDVRLGGQGILRLFLLFFSRFSLQDLFFLFLICGARKNDSMQMLKRIECVRERAQNFLSGYDKAGRNFVI